MGVTLPSLFFGSTMAAVLISFVAIQLHGTRFEPWLPVPFSDLGVATAGRLRFPEMDLKSLKLLVLRAFGTISNCITRGSFFRPRNRLGNLHFWRGLQGVFVGLQSGGQWRGEGPSAFGFFDGPKLKFSINSSTSSSDPP